MVNKLTDRSAEGASMKIKTFWKLYIVAFITLLFISLSTCAIEQDKEKHLVSSSIISAVIYQKTKSKKKAFYGCMAVGVLKELTDKKVSGKDLLADMAGCALIPYGIRFVKDGIKLQRTWRF